MKATCSAFRPFGEDKKSARTWMKSAQSRSTAHHAEQQDMSMIVRVICWELECAKTAKMATTNKKMALRC